MLAQPVICRDLVGRKAELAHLHERRREASRGHGGLVLIAGDAGVGKTRLLAEFKASLASARVRVVSSQCRQFAQRPYAPVLDAIGRIDSSAARIEPAASRDEQFERMIGAYLAAAQRGGVVALIEDIHWTDPATIELLATLATAAQSERLLLVATHRPDATAESEPMFAALGRLASVRNASRIELAPLGRTEIVTLIDHALDGVGELAAATRKAIANLSEGNPLFAEELAKNAVERSRAGTAGEGLPTTIRAAVLERLRPLQPDELDVLAHAAVIGREFGVALLEAALDLPPARVRTALQHARLCQLIVEGRAGEFRFRHALTRETIYESFLELQLRDLHRRIATALEALPESAPIQALAYHWWAARDAERAVAYGIRAGDEATALFAYEEAIRFFTYATDFVAYDSAESATLRRKILRAFAYNGERAQALRVAAETAAILERLGDIRQECDVRIDWAVESYNLGLRDVTSPLTDMSERLRAPEYEGIRTRLDLTRAQLLAIRDRDEEAQALLRAIGPPSPDTEFAAALSYFATAALLQLHSADIAGYLESTQRMLQIAADHNRPSHRAVVLSNAASVLTRIGRLAEAEEFLAQAKTISRQHNFRSQLEIALASEIALLYRRGDLETAKARLAEALEIGTDHDVARLQLAAYGTALGLLTGDGTIVERCFDETRLRRDDHAGFIAFSYAEHLMAIGRAPEAQELLHRALGNVGAGNQGPFELPLAIARWGAEADTDQARAQLASLVNSPSHPLATASLALFDAYRAARRGYPDIKRLGREAANHFALMGLPLWEADGLRLAGDIERARALYERMGALSRLRELEREARDSTPGADPREGILTVREREVAELVAAGLSNAEIAAKLFVTTKAVEKHLGSIYKKLDFSSRGKLIVYMNAP